MQLGNGPNSCTEFVERTWRTMLHFFKPKIDWRVASTSTVNPDEREFVVDSRAYAYDEQDGIVTTQSKCHVFPRLFTTANGSTDTIEEVTVDVKDVDMFVTIELFEGIPAVLLPEKLFEDNGYSYEWEESQTPNLTQNVAQGYLANATTSCLSSFLVYQSKHTLRARWKIQLKTQRS